MFKFQDKTRNVQKAAEKAAFKNIGHALASIRRDMIKSIKRRVRPSRPGEPPHTRRGLFKRSIYYAMAADKKSGVVGFAHSIAGEAAALHEHGESIGNQRYPVRPTAAPALDRAIPRIGNQWRDSIGN